LIAVTITKDHPDCAAFVDVVNTFYGRGNVPIGVVQGGVTPQQSKFTVLAGAVDDGAPRYPHDLSSGADAPDATRLLREVLSKQPNGSVAIAQVGFSTNLARLLDSPGDDVSPMTGRELVAAKVEVLSLMAGAFAPIDGKEHREYNVVMDIPSARKVASEWPTPMVWSGFEIGIALPFPAECIDHDFAYVKQHPVQEAYQLYQPTPHERPTWDLTSALWAVRPERGYFQLSGPGTVTVDDKGVTTFKESARGRHRYLILDPAQKERVLEALALLVSEPPKG